MFLQTVACPEAAHTCKAPPIRSSLSGQGDPASPGRRLKCVMVTLGLLKVNENFPIGSGSTSPVPQ
jgi:hypothetical protein